MDTIIDAVHNFLACPKCHNQLTVDQNTIFCQSCDFVGQISEDVVITMDYSQPSYFDQSFEILQKGENKVKRPSLSLYVSISDSVTFAP